MPSCQVAESANTSWPLTVLPQQFMAGDYCKDAGYMMVENKLLQRNLWCQLGGRHRRLTGDVGANGASFGSIPEIFPHSHWLVLPSSSPALE